MRSRTVREGSVGLLILLGFGVLGGLYIWLQRLNPGQRSFQTTIRFPNIEGMQIGAPVRYRGVVAGRITAIRVSANYAEVDVRITPATVIIPKDITIESKQSGLVGETFIDITPNQELPEAALAQKPLAASCDESLIVCNGSYLQGSASITFTELLSSMIRFTDLFSSPEFFGNVQTLTKNFAAAAEGVDTLSGEVTVLSKSVRGELSTLSGSARQSSESIGRAADQISVTANQFGLTAGELQGLIAENRSTLVRTLDDIDQTVLGVQSIVSALSPAFEDGEFAHNLQALSTNAAEASANLRNFSTAVGSSENLLLLQQTLDSARSTFQNAQKITADLDELTGDPNFRQNIQRLVNGLGGLVSSAEDLRQQTQMAQLLAPAAAGLQQAETAETADSAATSEAASEPAQAAERTAHPSANKSLPPLSNAAAPITEASLQTPEAKLRAQLRAAEALQSWSRQSLPSPLPERR
ncbi:MAG: MCE family protein [Pegethrix bostrychoides GSE-TBD4-15B]|jgi:phospholipid/cholesterol/gamma-HCH transport system substrate-binding protein|uniref:MCE family protein n=1 Tax=Pegethrix bostrychoides GSE-TBD4-15B TaxID=2839662 RepID=A0A951U6H5_9CYAN|nr:MCE family protein [Pegethrix bostrychoides GSE-TBD4-15B]